MSSLKFKINKKRNQRSLSVLQVPNIESKKTRSRLSTKDTINVSNYSEKPNLKSFDDNVSICSIDEKIQNKCNLNIPSSFDNIDDLLDVLKSEMTLEINETSKIIIELRDTYKNQFKPTKENLIIFRGFFSMISEDTHVFSILESLPWSDYNLKKELQGNSVESY